MKATTTNTCGCGCGTKTDRVWAPGHDQRARGMVLRGETLRSRRKEVREFVARIRKSIA